MRDATRREMTLLAHVVSTMCVEPGRVDNRVAHRGVTATGGSVNSHMLLSRAVTTLAADRRFNDRGLAVPVVRVTSERHSTDVAIQTFADGAALEPLVGARGISWRKIPAMSRRIPRNR